jgi:hypothetical protein
VVTVTPQKLYPWRKSLWYPLDRRLGGLQSLSGNSLPYRDSNYDPLIVQPVTARFTDKNVVPYIKVL